MDRKKKTNLAAFGKPVKYSFKETVLSSQGTEIIFNYTYEKNYDLTIEIMFS